MRSIGLRGYSSEEKADAAVAAEKDYSHWLGNFPLTVTFNWLAGEALNRSHLLGRPAVAMRGCALRLGTLMRKRRSEVFRMAKDANGIDPETILNEAELEVLVSWMVDIRKALLATEERQAESR